MTGRVTGIGPLHVLVLAGLVISVICLSGCTDQVSSPGPVSTVHPSASGTTSTIARVEVIHFHGDQQCTSCIVVGALANETVHEFFATELASGRVAFRSINYDDPANDKIVKEYHVTGSSLWITLDDDAGSHKLQDLDVWSLTNDRDRYKAYLSAIIAKRLKGDLS
jgi:hypothetical protein